MAGGHDLSQHEGAPDLNFEKQLRQISSLHQVSDHWLQNQMPIRFNFVSKKLEIEPVQQSEKISKVCVFRFERQAAVNQAY